MPRIIYLTFIRLYAKGEKKAPFMELLCHFQYQIDFNMCSITSALHSMIGNHCIEGYHAIVKSDRLEYSFPYSQLDEFFLEPQMMNELDILNYETQIVGFNNTSVPRLLYSYKELENAVSTVEEVFSKYDVKECVELLEAKKMVAELKDHFKEDYSIRMTEDQFNDFCSRYPHLKLGSNATEYFDALNERPAFFGYGGYYYSTVLLLIRFIENAIYGLLRRKTRFRIKAGFVFEKKVENLLEKYGFTSTKVKRISRQEFDVICMKDGCAYNFQCKNNYLDISNISVQNLHDIIRKNKKLLNYYQRALKKENFRTKLVQNHFGVENVENYVVARFPIVINHERVMPYNKLEGWLRVLN